jgi:hypothetical protein
VEVDFLSGAASLKQCPGFRRISPERSPGGTVASARMRNRRYYPRRPDQSSSHGCLADHLVEPYPRARQYTMSILIDRSVRTECHAIAICARSRWDGNGACRQLPATLEWGGGAYMELEKDPTGGDGAREAAYCSPDNDLRTAAYLRSASL